MNETRNGAPQTKAGRRLVNDFLNGPGGFGYAGVNADELERAILAIEQEAARPPLNNPEQGERREASSRSEPTPFAMTPAPDLVRAAERVIREWDKLGPTGTRDTITAHHQLREALEAARSLPEPQALQGSPEWDTSFHRVSATGTGALPDRPEPSLNVERLLTELKRLDRDEAYHAAYQLALADVREVIGRLSQPPVPATAETPE